MPRMYPRKVEQISTTSIPTAPFAQILRCAALLQDGKECMSTRKRPQYQYCRFHYQEYKDLYCEYKQQEKEYKALELGDTDVSPALFREKIARGRRVIALRDQVNRRFFSVSDGNRRHVRWILMLNKEVDALEERSKMGANEVRDGDGPAQEEQSGPASDSAESEAHREVFVYRSLLSPDVPMSDLDNLPDDSPVKVLKSTIALFSDTMRQRLYKIAPSLDDSSPVIKDGETGKSWTPDDGDKVIRFVLREIILWKADTEVLALASKTDSIDNFLQQRPSDTREYIKFFENLGREDTLHLLRDAVCDYVLPPDSSAVRILGEQISTDNETRRMTVEAWDILYHHFPDFLKWATVEFFCFRFEDVLLIKRLIALKRYHPQWYGGECEEQPMSVFLGFISVTQGSQDPLIPLAEKDGVITTTENRCYLVGRISKHDATTRMLVQELLKRIAGHIVVVYENCGDVFRSPNVTHKTDALDESFWITRSRSADTHARLNQTSWSTIWSLKNIRNDVEFLNSCRERNMVRDYVEILIIDRQPGRIFSLYSLVNDALMMINNDPTHEETMRSAICKSIPENEQTQWMDVCSFEGACMEDRYVGNIHYEGARLRAWDVQQEQPDLIRSSLNTKLSFRDRRLICKILDDMEASGVISQLKEPQKSIVISGPTLLDGTDGLKDLYFHYDFGPIDESSLALRPLGTSLAPDSLSSFAHAFQAVHPGAIFAKGRISVHYCAWPMPAALPSAWGIPILYTSEGYLYRWNFHFFDFPLSQRAWQSYVDHAINRGLPFARCVGTTLVIAASDSGEAEKNLTLMIEATKKNGWILTVPRTSSWTNDIDSLALSKLWAGISPV